MAVVCGEEHTSCLADDGTVHTFGDNLRGQLGLPGNVRRILTPTKIPFTTNIISVACGAFHSVCLDFNNTVWTFGGNIYGQLGLGHLSNRKIPQQVPLLSDIHSIACGTNHTLCIDANGEVFAFGKNQEFQLGIGNISHVSTPEKIPGLRDIVLVDAGTAFSMFVSSEGDLYIAGNYDHYQAGKFTIEVSQIHKLPPVKDIACGPNFCVILTANGELMSNGKNHYGELGNGTTTSTTGFSLLKVFPDNIVSVACGNRMLFVVDNTGNLFGCGYNTSALGLTLSESSVLELTRIDAVEEVVMVASNNHTIVKTFSGIVGFGSNKKGELGLETKLETNSPTKFPKKFSNIIGFGVSKTPKAKSARK